MGTMLSGEGGPMAQLGAAPEQLAAMTGPLQQMMRSIGGAMFGTQIGQAVGELAGEVVGSTDVGLPLAPEGTAALLPANVTAFGAGPRGARRPGAPLPRAARVRAPPAVRPRAVAARAPARRRRGVRPRHQRRHRRGWRRRWATIDPTDPESLQQALTGGMFEPEDTPEQKAALARLETALALVEGWVDEVVDAAAAGRLPAAGALRETVRRRRASGGPAEQTFASLVGLELRPRRLREAADLWRLVLEARGQDGREAVWAHPDLVPTAEDLDDPAGFAAGGSAPLDLSGLDDTEAPPEPPAPGTAE